MNLLVDKELFHCFPVLFTKPSMMKTNAKRKGEAQIRVTDALKKLLHLMTQ